MVLWQQYQLSSACYYIDDTPCFTADDVCNLEVVVSRLAMNALRGYKEGFTAFRHSRQCMGTSEECKHEGNRLSRARH